MSKIIRNFAPGFAELPEINYQFLVILHSHY